MSVATAPLLLKPISKAEIAKHNKQTDAWTTHNGYVYDVTEFIADGKHPGGGDVFAEYLGKDCTEGLEGSDHSPFAYNLIKEFVIGTVQGEKQVEMFPVPSKQMRGYEVTEVRDTVDFKKPLLPQIYNAGDRYWPWIINRPVTTHFEIFPIRFVEDNMTRWPWFYIWILFPPIIIYQCWLSLNMDIADGGSEWDFSRLISSFIVGFISWTLAEYILHRFVFHYETSSTVGNVVHFFLHGVHHLLPSDSTRLTFPPPMSLALAGMFFKLFYLTIPNSLLSYNAFFAGFALGYICYDTAHYFFHHTDFNNRIFRFCKSAHLGHHYKNEDMNFGVTSPVWDLVFGTYDPYNVTSDDKKKN